MRVETTMLSMPATRRRGAAFVGCVVAMLCVACTAPHESSQEELVSGIPDSGGDAPNDAGSNDAPALGCCRFQVEYHYTDIVEDGCVDDMMFIENYTDLTDIDFATCVGTSGTTGTHSHDKSTATCSIQQEIQIDFWENVDESPCRG